VRIRFRENGPYVVELPPGAKVRLNGEEIPLPKGNLALCRCGGSQKKPFCDGTHKTLGFQAEAGEIRIEVAQG
jgi:CDGSH-type Zn-finger protein